jgi:hypothetical protein
MRVQFKSEGGFAYLPGLNQPVTFDTGELSPEEGRELEQMTEAAGFFELPASSGPSRGGADFLNYTISISSSERSHTVRIAEPVEDPQLRALVDYLEEKTRELRASSRARGSS